MPTLAELGEFEVIRRLAAVRSETTGIVTGAGDDAAVLRTGDGHDLVVTTDAFVEGRHYVAEWMSAEQAGRRLATANLSDLAAMAATPRWGLHSIGVRGDQEIAWLEHFERGVDRALGSCQRSAGMTPRYATAASFTIARMDERSRSSHGRMLRMRRACG
jgi:thiamine monophosphate kinase